MAPMHQGLHRRAHCRIDVNGRDVTSELNPYLISVRIVLTTKGEYNTCSIELDDRNAELAIPPPDSIVQCSLGWADIGPSTRTDLGSSGLRGGTAFDGTPGALPQQAALGDARTVVSRSGADLTTVPTPAGSEFTTGTEKPAGQGQLAYEGGMPVVFTGKVLEVESGGARSGGGRRLWITATSPDIMGPGKSPNSQSQGEGDKDDSGGGEKIPFQDFAKKVFEGTGVNVQIQSGIGGITRDAWQQAGESPFHWLQNMAKKLGGRVRASPNDPNTLLVETDWPEATIDAWWGWNLIAWRLKPFVPRPQWKSAASNFFNIAQGGWQDTISSIAGQAPHANAGTGGFGQAGTTPNADVGGQENEGAGAESESARGRGWVMLNGDPFAVNGGRVIIQGARPGVDGSWGMVEVEHTYSRRGFTTRCELEDPQEMAEAYHAMGWPTTEREGGVKTSTPQTGDEPITPDTPPEASVSIDELQVVTPETGINPGSQSP